jgi:hypothetical protein
MARCRSCPARIEWGRTAGKRRRIPLDPDPNERGNLVVVSSEPMFEALAGPSPIVKAFDTPDAAAAYRLQHALGPETQRISHFATCPNAGKHRRRRRQADDR